MLVWKQWAKVTTCRGTVTRRKEYKLLLLFGIVPIFVSINGQESDTNELLKMW